MTLISKAQKLHDRLSEWQSISGQLSEAATYRSRRQEFEEADSTLTAVLESVMALQETDHAFELPSKQLTSLRNALAKAYAEFEANPGSIVGQDFNGKLFKATHQNAITALEAATRVAWKDFIYELSIVVDPYILDIFDKTPQLQSDLTKVKQIRDSLDNMAETWPVTATKIKKCQDLSRDLKGTWERSLPKSIPETVKKFLKAAKSKDGAPADLYTPDVSEWLMDNALLHLVRMSLG
jgi:hypothetical protein